MIIVSFNVKGCGNPLKKKRIQQILRKGKADICFFTRDKIEANELYDDSKYPGLQRGRMEGEIFDRPIKRFVDSLEVGNYLYIIQFSW